MVPVGGFSFASLNNVFNRGLILAIELHSLVNRAPLFLSESERFNSIGILSIYIKIVSTWIRIHYIFLNFFILYIYIYLQSINFVYFLNNDS